jgi:hypothetical protein
MSNKQQVIDFIMEMETILKEQEIQEASDETIEVLFHYTNYVLTEILQYCKLLQKEDSKIIREADIDVAIQLFAER